MEVTFFSLTSEVEGSRKDEVRIRLPYVDLVVESEDVDLRGRKGYLTYR